MSMDWLIVLFDIPSENTLFILRYQYYDTE